MTILSKTTFVLFLVFAASQIQAQQSNSQKRSAGKYQIELSDCCATLNFHIYNYLARPVRGLPIKGYVDLFYPDGSQLTVVLQQHDLSDFLSANVVYPGFMTLRVILVVGEEKISATFSVEHYRMVQNKPSK